MRRCTNIRKCGIVVGDNDDQCPVCGAATADAGAPKIEKQNYDKDVRVVMHHRRPSCIGILFGLVAAAVVLYFVYEKLSQAEVPHDANSAISNKVLDALNRGPEKKTPSPAR